MENGKVLIIRGGRSVEYANCFSQEEEIRNARYEKRRITEERIYKGTGESTSRVEEMKD